MKSVLKTLTLSGLSIIPALNTMAQSTMSNVLDEIAVNNKTLQAYSRHLEAKDISYRTGLAPSDPVFTYDYLTGGSVYQHEISVTQSFDFPTTYAKKNQLVREKTALSPLQMDAIRQDILLEAKKVCIAIVYHNRLNIQLQQRSESFTKLLEAFRNKLAKGDGHILDVHKAEIQLIGIEKAIQDNHSRIRQLQQKLTELNGGNSIAFVDTTYADIPDIPTFEELEAEYERNDPLRKILLQETSIAQKAIEVSKAAWWPRMELGYRYEGRAGQSLNGLTTGISIPLWANRNTVKHQHAVKEAAVAELDAHVNEHYYHILHMYEQYENLKKVLEKYFEIFSTISNHIALLNKSLAYGQISSMEYFLEINWFNDAYDTYLQTERDYHEIIAELYKFRL